MMNIGSIDIDTNIGSIIKIGCYRDIWYVIRECKVIRDDIKNIPETVHISNIFIDNILFHNCSKDLSILPYGYIYEYTMSEKIRKEIGVALPKYTFEWRHNKASINEILNSIMYVIDIYHGVGGI